MLKQTIRRFSKIISWALVLLFIAGCTRTPSGPSQTNELTTPALPMAASATPPDPTQAGATDDAVIPQTAEETPEPTTEAPTPTPIPADKSHLYQDDFTDPDSGWPGTINFDNYYIGYHEPEFFHVEVHAPNDRAVVALPDRTFTDVTLEVQVFVDMSNTAPEGDFRYGLMFRRSGSQYYAYTISPRSQDWQLLKVSPTGTQVLKEGHNATIQGLDGNDRLRVDVRGTQMFVWANDQLLDQASDADYTSGEVGFYVETFDSQRVHVHNDAFIVREAQAPQFHCQVAVTGLNLREGPSLRERVITTLGYRDRFEPLARNGSSSWLRIRSEDQYLLGWVSNMPAFYSCPLPLEDLPIQLP